MNATHRMSSTEWVHPFTARPAGVAELRRLTRFYLELWGLPGVGDAALLCVSELATNVINHVGEGAAAVLSVMVRDAHLRISVRDAESGRFPRLLGAAPTSETGRGLGLVAAMADRWGVTAAADGKTTWCEISASCTAQVRGTDGLQSSGAAVPVPSSQGMPGRATQGPPLHFVAQEAAAVGLIAEVLRWLQAQGRDPDTVLDYAQMRFEGECGVAG
ncbi:ATP-binding protein [Streptomyces sp. DSM 41527]|uniref:ATP-binding protein n=1 Tax=Streptomyces mooreae TaxID=3075523 RepID=A0ABU2TCU0_9ACTN|nr:ATP-binding protein [Streptomyces sp. DSM 41527]MDT0458758.1 ATP-binding protein [Streptomyces sp. DSM 41527]